MNDKQDKIVRLLWNYHSLRDEHIKKLCNCTDYDIDLLISKKMLVRESESKIIRYQGKQINNRNIAAFDVVMEYLDRTPKIKKGKGPVTLILETKYTSYDVIAIKEDEIEALFENIEQISTSEKIIIIIQTKEYEERNIKTDKECLICTFSPLKIVDKVN